MNKFSNGVEVPGTETQDPKIPDVSTIKDWLRRDLQVSVSMLTALRDDVDLQAHMAEWMYGRYLNHLNRKDMPNGRGPL